MFQVLILLKRKPGLSMANFVDYYESRHAPLGFSYMPSARRYARRYLSSTDRGSTDEPEFDVVTEIWFDDRAAYDAAMAVLAQPEIAERIARDEENLFDRRRTRMLFVTEHETRVKEMR